MTKNKITTKFGDGGKTKLFSGETVSKSSLRVDTYGDIDELVCVLGVARQHAKDAEAHQDMHEIQTMLLIASSEVATSPGSLGKLSVRIDTEKLQQLEAKLEKWAQRIRIPDGFVVSGASLSSSHIDHARTIARRCERKIVQLTESGELKNNALVPWFNRLSDYLYLLARSHDDPTGLAKE